MNVSDMAQIPYIEHERRMYKAYKREKFLKLLLVGSNLLWLSWSIVWFVMG